MRVNVFITRGDGKNKLLVLPMSPEAVIPADYQVDWVYYASVSTSDRMFLDVDAATIEDEIAVKGFAIVSTEVPDRRSA
jgi:hypothetical protein